MNDIDEPLRGRLYSSVLLRRVLRQGEMFARQWNNISPVHRVLSDVSILAEWQKRTAPRKIVPSTGGVLSTAILAETFQKGRERSFSHWAYFPLSLFRFHFHTRESSNFFVAWYFPSSCIVRALEEQLKNAANKYIYIFFLPTIQRKNKVFVLRKVNGSPGILWNFAESCIMVGDDHSEVFLWRRGNIDAR